MLLGWQFSNSSWYFGSIRSKVGSNGQNGNRNQKIVLQPTHFSSSWQLGNLAARGKSDWKEEERIQGVSISEKSEKYSFIHLRNMHLSI